MGEPADRILMAWLDTGRTLGNFLANAAFLAGVRMEFMTDLELAKAAEDYRDWLKTYRVGR